MLDLPPDLHAYYLTLHLQAVTQSGNLLQVPGCIETMRTFSDILQNAAQCDSPLVKWVSTDLFQSLWRLIAGIGITTADPAHALRLLKEAAGLLFAPLTEPPSADRVSLIQAQVTLVYVHGAQANLVGESPGNARTLLDQGAAYVTQVGQPDYFQLRCALAAAQYACSTGQTDTARTILESLCKVRDPSFSRSWPTQDKTCPPRCKTPTPTPDRA